MAKHRAPVGILEAAMALVLAGILLWSLRPVPAARAAAAEERTAIEVLGRIADAEDALAAGRRGAPFLRLDRLAAASPAAAAALEGWTPSEVPGVYGNRSFWIAVLLPGTEGWIAAPGREDGAAAARGFCVVAWPRREAPRVLRALAALPGGGLWQRGDGMPESGAAARPPVPRAHYPAAEGGPPKVPPPPPDWALSRRRKG